MRLGDLLRFVVTVLICAVLTDLAASADGSVAITFWHGMSGVLQPAVNELTDDFNRLNPGIVVNALYQGNYGALNQKLIAAVAAGTRPRSRRSSPTGPTSSSARTRLSPSRSS